MIILSTAFIIFYDYIFNLFRGYFNQIWYNTTKGSDRMDASKIIKQIMIEKNLTVKDLAEKLEMQPQSLSNKLHRNSFSLNSFIKIIDVLDCDIQIVTRENHKIFK